MSRSRGVGAAFDCRLGYPDASRVYRARAAQAEADLLGAKAAIENLKARKAAQHAQVAEAEDAIKATQADVERTRLEAARQRTLLATTFGTRASWRVQGGRGLRAQNGPNYRF
jgi:hypothetical protein